MTHTIAGAIHPENTPGTKINFYSPITMTTNATADAVTFHMQAEYISKNTSSTIANPSEALNNPESLYEEVNGLGFEKALKRIENLVDLLGDTEFTSNTINTTRLIYFFKNWCFSLLVEKAENLLQLIEIYKLFGKIESLGFSLEFDQNGSTFGEYLDMLSRLIIIKSEQEEKELFAADFLMGEADPVAIDAIEKYIQNRIYEKNLEIEGTNITRLGWNLLTYIRSFRNESLGSDTEQRVLDSLQIYHRSLKDEIRDYEHRFAHEKPEKSALLACIELYYIAFTAEETLIVNNDIIETPNYSKALAEKLCTTIVKTMKRYPEIIDIKTVTDNFLAQVSIISYNPEKPGQSIRDVPLIKELQKLNG